MPPIFSHGAIKPFLLMFALCLSVAASCQSQKEQSGTVSTRHSLPAVYQNWLDEDVRWIITSEEKAAFGRLVNDEERNEFVVQFWLRRDPTPDSEENEYKEEHYRRIAYSNVHFASRTKGSLTDRGRIYIVYGPPDTTNLQHDSAVPTEVWHYRALREPDTEVTYGDRHQPPPEKEADFTFTDKCKCNDYRLQAPEAK